MTSFGQERYRIHHDYFLNRLVDRIGSGWDANDRLAPNDAVLRAVEGNQDALGRLRLVVSEWKEDGSVALANLLSMGKQSKHPTYSEADARAILEADAIICGILDGDRHAAPVVRAAAFWEACDRIDALLTKPIQWRIEEAKK